MSSCFIKSEEKSNPRNNATLLIVRPVSECENVGLKTREIENDSHFVDEGMAKQRR